MRPWEPCRLGRKGRPQHPQLLAVQLGSIGIGNLQFAPGAGLKAKGDLHPRGGRAAWGDPPENRGASLTISRSEVDFQGNLFFLHHSIDKTSGIMNRGENKLEAPSQTPQRHRDREVLGTQSQDEAAAGPYGGDPGKASGAARVCSQPE